MKVLFAMMTLAGVATFTPAAHAKHGDIRPPRRPSYTCYAQGSIGLGGPIGEVWQTASGQGRDEADASYAALRNCTSSGLRGCFVQNCWQDR